MTDKYGMPNVLERLMREKQMNKRFKSMGFVTRMGFVVTWTMIGIVTAAIAIGVGSRFLLKKADNPVEQICEKIILNETGIVIDLSPDVDNTGVDGMDLTMTTRKGR